MRVEENWNVPVLWQVVICHFKYVFQPHIIFYHVNPLRIDVATPFFQLRRLPESVSKGKYCLFWMALTSKYLKQDSVISDEAVMVLWDPIPELDEFEMEYPQRLLPSKRNPDKPTTHGWRLDIDIEQS